MRNCNCREWVEGVEVEGGCCHVLDWSLNLLVEEFIMVVLESGAMQAMWLCNLNFSDHQLAYTNLILQYTTQVLSLSLSLKSIYILSFRSGLCLPKSGFKVHHLDGMHSPDLMVLLPAGVCCCVRCSGLEFAVNFLGWIWFLYVWVAMFGCQETPRKSGEIFLNSSFKIFCFVFMMWMFFYS